MDLSGPHEATPMPGHRVGSNSGHYFLVLAVIFDEVGDHEPMQDVDANAEIHPNEAGDEAHQDNKEDTEVEKAPMEHTPCC